MNQLSSKTQSGQASVPFGEAPQCSIWGIPAPEASVVALIASYSDGKRTWRHVMRLDLKSGELTHGAWTTLRFKVAHCLLSSHGTFWSYTASDRRGRDSRSRPFLAYYGGGVAIARVPWLSALTHIEPAVHAGGGPSQHALGEADQRRLRAMFAGRDGWQSAEAEWWSTAQPGWMLRHSGALARTAATRGRATRTLRLSRPGMAEDLWCLVQRARRGSTEARRYFLCASGTGEDNDARFEELQGAQWAWLDAANHLVAAYQGGGVAITKFRREAGWCVVRRHELGDLRPLPGPSPESARAKLDRREYDG